MLLWQDFVWGWCLVGLVMMRTCWRWWECFSSPWFPRAFEKFWIKEEIVCCRGVLAYRVVFWFSFAFLLCWRSTCANQIYWSKVFIDFISKISWSRSLCRRSCVHQCVNCVAVLSKRNGFAPHFSVVWFLVLQF